MHCIDVLDAIALKIQIIKHEQSNGVHFVLFITAIQILRYVVGKGAKQKMKAPDREREVLDLIDSQTYVLIVSLFLF